MLDPADATLDFVQKKENTRPIAIYRIENDFLLCYDGKSHMLILQQTALISAVL